MSLLHRVAGCSLREGEKLSYPLKARSRAAAAPHGEEPFEVAGASGPDAPMTPPWGGVRVMSHWAEAQETVSRLAWEPLGVQSKRSGCD